MNQDIEAIQAEVEQKSKFLSELTAQIRRVIVGQDYLVDRLLIGLLADGHILIEGVPGLAKTLSIRTLADSIAASFQRIQFTPDLLPADLIGTMVFSPQEGKFYAKKGPIFAHLILADEINRAPAKVQSALLEAMQERQVTIGEATYPLDRPFMVLATQNPIEQEGTYPLPEAQVDRFMLKIKITYPQREEELEIMNRMTVGQELKADKVIQPTDILEARKVINEIYVDEKVKDYIVNIVMATRQPEAFDLPLSQYIAYGASPRASICLNLASKAHAFLRGRGYITPEDVKQIGMDVLRHRIILTYEAEAEELTSEDIVQKIFNEIEVP
ncbi:MAG: AAA domain-containing protein [candidate division Zixibacteria bacterium]|nr:AAA domain-containing protein [candidate division Zixibacteria bacterium]